MFKKPTHDVITLSSVNDKKVIKEDVVNNSGSTITFKDDGSLTVKNAQVQMSGNSINFSV